MSQEFTATLMESGPPGQPGAGTVGVGRVSATGVLFGARAGWSCAHPEVGTYTITHNLNFADPQAYVVLATPSVDPQSELEAPPQTSLVIAVAEQTATAFTLMLIQGSDLAPIDKAFNFGVFQ